MHYWLIAKILKLVSNLFIRYSWWIVILIMAFPGTYILIDFPELMGKWWQLSRRWVSSRFILPKLWQPWMTFTDELLFMVGITMFQSNLFPCRHFFFTFYQNLLQLPECFTHVTVSSTLCIMMEKCLRTTAIGPGRRCVYFVVYKCMSFCSLNRIGYDLWTGYSRCLYIDVYIQDEVCVCLYINAPMYIPWPSEGLCQDGFCFWTLGCFKTQEVKNIVCITGKMTLEFIEI